MIRTFKNVHFKARDYEATNVVACQGESPPNETDWKECSPIELDRLSKLWIENGRTFYGWL
jgi:hypothetical protein